MALVALATVAAVSAGSLESATAAGGGPAIGEEETAFSVEPDTYPTDEKDLVDFDEVVAEQQEGDDASAAHLDAGTQDLRGQQGGGRRLGEDRLRG